MLEALKKRFEKKKEEEEPEVPKEAPKQESSEPELMDLESPEALQAKVEGVDPAEIIQSLREAERVWFRRLLSHNIRMPMTIIAGYGDLLKNHSLKTREEEIECISKICKNIQYLDTLFKVLVE